MTVIEGIHRDHGATFADRGGRRVVADYGRHERTHRAVRNAAGTIELGYDVRIITGPDRHDALDAVVTIDVPRADGRGSYGFLLDGGAVAADAAVYDAAASDRLLVFCPPGWGGVLDEQIDRDATGEFAVDDATEAFAVFGVHGSRSTETVASVLSTGSAPEPPLTFERGTMGDEGVTVVAGDGVIGEEGYEVVCAAADATRVFDTLVNRGLNAVPFGYRTFESLTLEAGTPLFDPDLRGRDPSILAGSDGTGERLVGLAPERLPSGGATVYGSDGAIGTVTRAVTSPTLAEPIAFGVVDGVPEAVETPDGRVGVERAALPFVEGTQRSGRLPGA